MLALILSLTALIISSTSAFSADWCNNASMKGAWKMEETSSTYTDCTTNANAGTVTGTVTRGSTGKFGLAVEYTQANNSYVGFGSAASLDDVRPISVGGWIAPDTTGDTSVGFCSAGGIMAKTNNADGWAFCLHSTADLRFAKELS